MRRQCGSLRACGLAQWHQHSTNYVCIHLESGVVNLSNLLLGPLLAAHSAGSLYGVTAEGAAAAEVGTTDRFVSNLRNGEWRKGFTGKNLGDLAGVAAPCTAHGLVSLPPAGTLWQDLGGGAGTTTGTGTLRGVEAFRGTEEH